MNTEQNTQVDYMYRDGSNYKQYGRAVFPGAITSAEHPAIVAARSITA